MARKHPRVRTWTLASLEPSREYRLWLDPASERWEVAPLEGGPPLRTRAPRDGSQRSERRHGETSDDAPDRTDTGALST